MQPGTQERSRLPQLSSGAALSTERSRGPSWPLAGAAPPGRPPPWAPVGSAARGAAQETAPGRSRAQGARLTLCSAARLATAQDPATWTLRRLKSCHAATQETRLRWRARERSPSHLSIPPSRQGHGQDGDGPPGHEAQSQTAGCAVQVPVRRGLAGRTHHPGWASGPEAEQEGRWGRSQGRRGACAVWRVQRTEDSHVHPEALGSLSGLTGGIGQVSL